MNEMVNSRTQNSLRNIIFGIINRVVSIVFPFIVRTIFIKVIGEEYLGLNSLYGSILQVISLADLGFASAIVASMYKPIAQHDVKRVSALLNLYRKIYRTIGTIILISGMIITPFIDKFISGNPPEDVNIYLLWLLYLLNSVSSYLFFAYKVSLICAHQRNDITEKIGTVTRILTSVLQIYAVAVLKNMYLYVALNIVCSVFYNIGCAYISKKLYPEYICKGRIDTLTKKKITKDIGALTIQKIGSTISLSLDAIIISSCLGLTSVAIYGNYNYIIAAITSFTTLVYGSITASIGNSIAVDTVQKNYNDLKKIFYLNTWIIGWCCICFMCLFQDFMVVWMGENLLLNIGAVFCLVLRFFAEQLRKVVLTYKDAAGMWWYDKWRPLVGCIVNLILNITLVKTIGIAGVAISTVVSYLLVEMPWETHVLFKNYFKVKELDYYKEMAVAAITMLIVGIATYLLCESFPIHSIGGIAVKLLICLIFPNILYIVLNIKNPYFIESKELIFKVKNTVVKRWK